MLKRKVFRKIIVSTSALFALLLIYLIPKEQNEELTIKQELEYINKDEITNSIFLIDNDNYLARTAVVVSKDTDIETRARELLEILITDGIGENKIPSGFRAILPSETKILSINYNEGLLKINFSKDMLDVKEEFEEKMIEAIIYTVTSIDEVDNIIIYVEGDILTKLPKSGLNLPSTLDRSYGINKEYDINTTKNINQVTIYYVNKHNDDYYYVPVTKYLNDNRDKIKIIVEELASASIYGTNLMSFLNSNTKLLAANNVEDVLNLSFNSYILNDVDNKDILEEVIYTICLSARDNYDINEVVFNIEDEEINKTVLKTLE